MKKDYDRICKAAPEFFGIATLEDFMRARALVNSRIFGTTIDKVSDDSIVPFADMFNYKYMADMTNWTFSAEKNAFLVKAKQHINAGEEIYVYYGNKPNSNFFQFYGFVIEDNENDEVILKFSINPDDKLRTEKMEILKKSSSEIKFKTTIKIEDKKFDELMSYLRFINFEGDAMTLKNVNSLLQDS